MADALKNLPIEERFIQHESDGKVVLIPALNKTWVKLSEKTFARYISHPDPGQKDYETERAVWLEMTFFMIQDLEWLLRQEHHIFWSHMIYSMEAQWMILTFLQDAPPFYVRNDFPKDEEMEYALAKIEHLIYLVLRRLATKKESPEHHIKNFGDLLYNSYLFSVPMFFDIFLIYGFKNRDLIGKLFYDVVSVSPKFLHDLGAVPHFFIKVLQMVKDRFDLGPVTLLTERQKHRPDLTRKAFLHLVDTCANMQVFFDINLKFAKCLRSETFLSEVAFFYTYVIPKIHDYIKKDESLESYYEKLDFVRLNLLSLVRSIFCSTINDIITDKLNRDEIANEYLTRLMDIIQEPLFISDYNKVYPLDKDLKIVRNLCPNMDSINLTYITQAVASCNVTKYTPEQLKEFRLVSLISEVRDILPHLGDGFVEFCLRFYDFDTEKVVTAIIEGTLPPNLDKLDRNMQRPDKEEQKLIRARIKAEKQYRMDRATWSGIKTGQKTELKDEVKTSAENEQKTDTPGTSNGNKQKGDKGGKNGKGKNKADKAGANVENEQRMDKAEANAESEQKMDKPGPSGKGKNKAVKSGAKGESEQKTDKPRTGGEGKQKDKGGKSGKGKQKKNNGGGKQKADKAGANDEGEQNVDKPGPSAEAEEIDSAEAARIRENQNIIDFFNEKLDLVMPKKIVNYSRKTESYDDEYDDTYDDNNLIVKEGRNVEEDKKSVASRKVYRTRMSEIEHKSSEEDSVDTDEDIKARLLQRRMTKLRNEFIANKKAQIASQKAKEREILESRRFKESHKSVVANHNRKKFASKKRNMNLDSM